MIAPGLLELVGIQDWPAFVLVSARVSGLFLAAPLWSMTGVPKTVRSAAVVLLSVVLLPSMPHLASLPDDMVAMSLVLAAETLLGIAIGLTGALVLHGVAIAGEVASLQMGLSLGEALGSLPPGATVGIGQLQGYFGMLIYLSLGGHLTLYRGLAASFAAVPAGQAVLGASGARQAVELASAVFSTGVRAAAPIIVALLLTNLAMAILGKAVPQLNVMMVSFPITISIGMVALAATLPFLAAFLSASVDGLPALVGQTIQAFTVAPVVR
jgi:flagellar biosynthetic protein FliR